MREEIRDLYLIMLGMEDMTEFQGKYETWPRNYEEFWYKGNIINYAKILEFLDKVYEERDQRNTTK